MEKNKPKTRKEGDAEENDDESSKNKLRRASSGSEKSHPFSSYRHRKRRAIWCPLMRMKGDIQTQRGGVAEDFFFSFGLYASVNECSHTQMNN